MILFSNKLFVSIKLKTDVMKNNISLFTVNQFNNSILQSGINNPACKEFMVKSVAIEFKKGCFK